MSDEIVHSSLSEGRTDTSGCVNKEKEISSSTESENIEISCSIESENVADWFLYWFLIVMSCH
jgi:hypothetical protein